MKDYYVDVEINNEIEQWLLDQGATVTSDGLMPIVDHGGRPKPNARNYAVYFNGERVYFWQGTNTARIYFSKENISTALILLVKWPDRIGANKLPKQTCQ